MTTLRRSVSSRSLATSALRDVAIAKGVIKQVTATREGQTGAQLESTTSCVPVPRFGIRMGVRQRAHEVRRVRNDWAHESDEDPGPMTVDEARARL
jgi:hypothetical protein